MDDDFQHSPFSTRSSIPPIREYSSRGKFKLGRNTGSSSNAQEGSLASSSALSGKEVPGAIEK
jgi:hypothetical protein